MSFPLSRLSPVLFLLLPLGCTGTSGDTGTAADSATVVDVAYADMDRDQRLAFMGAEVLPQMKAKFQAYDSVAFATFTCETCHGTDMVAVDYAMPNTGSPLDPTGFPYSASADPEQAAWGTFMETEIHPAMGALLGKELYDYASNPEGFSCYACHTMAG